MSTSQETKPIPLQNLLNKQNQRKTFQDKAQKGPTTEELAKEYQDNMEETEKIALKIAHRQLESSFV